MPPRLSAQQKYDGSVFINCPFDEAYLALLNAIVFVVFDCGFTPRCSQEEDNGGEVRFTKIQRMIEESKFGIHDISRTELDEYNGLPRFNMPLELGMFIGATRFGGKKQKQKNCLVLDVKPHRYQSFISDISGHDVRAHENDPEKVITFVRNWLSSESHREDIPGGTAIVDRFKLFQGELPIMCDQAQITLAELTYNDYANFVSKWLQMNERAVV